MRLHLLALVLLVCGMISCRQQVTNSAIQKAELRLPPSVPTLPLSLDGEWLFFPHELIDADSLHSENWLEMRDAGQLVELPGKWSDWNDPLRPGHRLPVNGYGTFILRIEGLDHWLDFALKTNSILTSSRIFFKGDKNEPARLLSVQGVVGTDAASSIPYEQDQLIPFSTQAPLGFLVIQVSNFQTRKSGLLGTILLGQEQSLAREDKVKYGLNLLVVGMMLSICLYNIFLFVTRPEDLSSLSLACFSLVVVARAVTTGNMLEYWMNEASWTLAEIRYKIEYGSIVLSPVVIAIFFNINYPKRFTRRYIQASLVLAILQFIPILLLSSSVYTPYLILFQVILLVSGTYATSCGIRVMWNRDPQWQYLALGGYPFSAAIVVDILVSRNLLPIHYTLQYVMVWFILTQSHVLGRRFAQAFRTASHLKDHLQKEVQMQTAAIAAQSRSMKAILDNVPVGVFTLSSGNLAIDQEYSQHMETIFQTKNVSQRHLSEFLLQNSRLGPDQIDQIQQVLQTIMKEDVLNFRLNETSLCHELVKRIEGNEKILDIAWVPILDDDDIVQKMLITVRDMSEIRKLTQESQERRDQVNRIAEILQAGKDRMQHFFVSTKRMLLECHTLARKQFTADSLNAMFINLHTIKGNGRQMHLQEITECAHLCEKYLQELRQTSKIWQKSIVEEHLQKLGHIVQLYEQQMIKLQLHSHLELLIQEQRPAIASLLQKARHNHALSSEEVVRLNAYAAATIGVDLKKILENAFSGINTLARDLGKEEPLVQISCPSVILSLEARDFLQNILVHMLRNSLDHGLETADERRKSGKPIRGQIKIWVTIEANRLHLNLQDDGRGLNIPKLKELLPATVRTLQDIASSIFHDGVTTAATVTEISGRGVGMAAIKRHIEDVGGQVSLVLGQPDIQGFCPFTIDILLPESCVVWADSPASVWKPLAS